MEHTPQATRSIPSPRTEICLDCRTALAEGERCDGGPRHRVTQLHQEPGRKRLLEEVWGAPDLRRRTRQLAKAGSVGAVLIGLLQCCAVVTCECGQFVPDVFIDAIGVGTLLLILAAVVASMGLVYVVATISDYVRKRRNALIPNGALARPHPPGGSRLRGTLALADGAALIKSSGGRPVAAHGLELRTSRFMRSGVMLRDGAAAELMVELDDGRRLQIPAGRVRVDASSSAQRLRPADLRRYLDDLDPLRRAADPGEHDALPFDDARERHMMPGDRVEVRGACEPFIVPGQASEAGGYRQAAASLLRPVGVPWLRAIG